MDIVPIQAPFQQTVDVTPLPITSVVASVGTLQNIPGSTPFQANTAYIVLKFAQKNTDLANGSPANNYNLSTGIFVAPLKGLYLFVVNLWNVSMVNNTSFYVSRLNIFTQNVKVEGPGVNPYSLGGLTDPSASFTTIWYCNAGDVIWPEVGCDTTVSQKCGNNFMVSYLHP